MKNLIGIFLLTVIVVSACSPALWALDGNTIAYWRLNERGNTVKDGSRNNNDGQVLGAQSVKGYRGRALQFDGNNKYVRVPDHASFDTQQITLEAWIKVQGTNQDTLVDEIIGKDNQYVFGIGDQIFQNHVAFSLGGMPAAFPTCHGSGFCDGGGPLTLDQWHHVAIQYNGTTVQTFIDGNVAMSYPMSFTMLASSDDLGIGARPQPTTGATEYFKGIIDEVRISSHPRY